MISKTEVGDVFRHAFIPLAEQILINIKAGIYNPWSSCGPGQLVKWPKDYEL